MKASANSTAASALLLTFVLSVFASPCAIDGVCVAQAHRLTIRDSSGVRIIENTVPRWQSGEAWTIDSNPVVQIGAADGDDPYLFGTVWNATRLRDGTIVVVDNESLEIRLFDASRKHIQTMGGRGGGPGEFEAPPYITLVAPDTILAWDSSQMRLTWFSLTGDVFGDESLALTLSSADLSRSTMRGTWHVLPDGTLLSSGIDVDRRPDGLQLYRHYTLVSGMGEVVRQIGRFDSDWNGRSDGTTVLRPFASSRSGCIKRDHRTYVAGAEGWEISVYDSSGALVELIRAPIPRTPVTDDMVDSARDRLRERLEQMRRDSRRVLAVFDRFKLPDSLPAINEVLCDEAGYMWVGRRTSGELAASATFDIFNNRHAWLGSVRLPEPGDVLHTGNGYVVALWTDDMHVPYVRVYTVQGYGR